MVLEFTTYTIPLLLVAVVGTGLFALTANYRNQKGAYSLMGVFGGAVLWAGGYAFQLSDPSLIAHHVRFTGAGVVPVSIFVLALQLTGREEWVNLRTAAGVYALPGLVLLLILTNGSHGLWADPATVASASNTAWGPAFYVGAAYLMVLAGAALAMFAQQTRQQDTGSAVNTASVFTVVTLIPVITFPLYAVGVTTLDWTPFTFVVSGLLMMAAMFYL